MKFYADLHIHSRYSLSTSRDLTLERLAHWAQLKGVTLLGAGDFTHPAWMKEMEIKLVQEVNGLYRLADRTDDTVPPACRSDVWFIPTAEVCCIFRRDGKTRRIHLLLFAPTLEDAARISLRLAPYGALSSDGRPILSLDARDLLEMVLEASPDTLVIPAHVWTPHFSLLGAGSAFGSVEECFGDLAGHIHAIESGLSADPSMIRRVSALDRLTIISASDAHSAAKIGREATVFHTPLTSQDVLYAIRSGKGVLGTVEFFPQEGKYFLDGHRPCNVPLRPSETVGNGYRCPQCGKKVTVGVLHRVELLADRSPEEVRADSFISLVSLPEILACHHGCGSGAKKVHRDYLRLLEFLGPEFRILLETDLDDLERVGGEKLAGMIAMLRHGEVLVEPGFDGKYGKISFPP